MVNRRTANIRLAFSLVELLAVFGILSILVALMLPAVVAAREAARRLSCQSNLKQLVAAVSNYESSFGGYPPAYILTPVPGTDRRGTNYSALSFALPFLEQISLFNQINFTQAGILLNEISPCNTTVAGSSVRVFLCPSDSLADESQAGTNYRMNLGSDSDFDGYRDGLFQPNASVKTAMVRDGLSNTLCASEKAHRIRLNWRRLGTRLGSLPTVGRVSVGSASVVHKLLAATGCDDLCVGRRRKLAHWRSAIRRFLRVRTSKFTVPRLWAYAFSGNWRVCRSQFPSRSSQRGASRWVRANFFLGNKSRRMGGAGDDQRRRT